MATASATSSGSVAEPPAFDPTKPAFRLRLRLDTQELCNVMGLAPVPGGGAWIVGDCNLRVFLDDKGMTDHRGAWTKKKFSIVGTDHHCTARWLFPAVTATSATDAYVLAERRCGMDPNGVWPEPLQRFFGGKWRELRRRRRAHLWKMWQNANGRLWGLDTESTLTHEDAIYEHSLTSGWRKTRYRTSPTPNGPTFDNERIAVTEDGTVWLQGSTAEGIWAGSKKSGWIWHDTGATGGGNDIWSAADGSVWIAGYKAVHRWHGGVWSRISDGAFSVWAASADDAWFAGNKAGDKAVRHWHKGSETVVQLRDELDLADYLTVRGSGERVWVMGRRAVWSLVAANTPAPEVHAMKVTMEPPKP